MKQYKRMQKELEQGIDLDRTISEVLNEMSSVFYSFSLKNFAMLYYDYYESIVEQRIVQNDHCMSLFHELNRIVKESLLQEFDGTLREDYLLKLHQIREQIMERMSFLTAHTDLLLLYEYVLNRTKPMETITKEEDQKPNEDEMAREILEYIFEISDNVIMNARVKEMIAQLPVRMTKTRFFDLLHTAILRYKGNTVENFEHFLFMLRSCAGLLTTTGKKDNAYVKLLLAEDELKQLGTKVTEVLEYQRLHDIFQSAAEQIKTDTDVYYSLAQLVNYVYTIVLNLPYAVLSDPKEKEYVFPIIAQVNSQSMSGENREINEDIVALFEHFEGSLEEEERKLSILLGLLDKISTSYQNKLDAYLLSELWNVQVLSVKLVMEGVFVKISQEEKDNGVKDMQMDVAGLEQAFEELKQELEHLMQEHSRLYKRALMAAVLKELPVFFENRTQVMEYVRTSLASGRDTCENQVGFQLMQELMQEARE